MHCAAVWKLNNVSSTPISWFTGGGGTLAKLALPTKTATATTAMIDSTLDFILSSISLHWLAKLVLVNCAHAVPAVKKL